ncbi:MAG: CoA transferase, partial [Thiomonas sp.]
MNSPPTASARNRRLDALEPHHPRGFKPLAGLRVLSLALNLPGPAALARLHALGVEARKIEPPAGDPMRAMCPPLYRAMHRGVAVRTLDLKTPAGQDALQQELRDADLLLTSFRPAALQRLGLGKRHLQRNHPALASVALVGQTGRGANLPGHDLTYQAQAGLIDAARLPPTLLADMTGALLAVEAAMGALMQAAARRGGGTTRNASPAAPGVPGAHLQVALADAASFAALPHGAGLTLAGGLLGGALPGYAVHPCRDGLVALAALEPHFAAQLATVAGGPSHAAIARWCKAHTVAELHALALEHDLPLEAWGVGPSENHVPERHR